MKTFAICPSNKKPEAHNYIMPMAKFLIAKGKKVFIDPEFTELFPLPPIDPKKPVDVIISLGGDGTLLYYKQKYSHFEDTLFTAANVGRLGFMADVHVEFFENYFEDIFSGEHNVEERLMVEATSPDNTTYLAINDFVFHRGGNPSMIELAVFINGVYFNTFQADGLIVATPTGSTAYTLAAGGPLVHPTLKAIIMTPICGHTLSSRPFVSHHDCLIEVKLQSDKAPITVTIDGIDAFPLHPGQSIKLTGSKKIFKLITYYKKHSFFSTLRDKLHWKGMSIQAEQ